jgi:hypothetical protein
MHYIINSDKPRIPCLCKADTPNVNLRRNIQHTKWQMEQDLAAAPATAQENPAAAAAAPIKIPVACPTTAVAAMIIQPLAPVAVGLTPTKITHTATKPAATMEVTRPQKASR